MFIIQKIVQILINFFKQKNVQIISNVIFCDQENGDVNCHIIIVNYQKGFNTKVFNTQMLQECKIWF